jgi:hypothetical protein
MSTVTMQFINIIEQYETEVDQLPDAHAKSGGASRNASGLVYENLTERTCVELGLDAKKNDYYVTEEIDGIQIDTLQVDWHIYKENLLRYFVECKCYLDASFLMRAIINMIELHNSPDNDNRDNVEYGVLAGQNACADDKLVYYRAFFKKMTGKNLNVFFVNPQVKRNSKKPIYKAEYREDFKLDSVVYNEFIEWLSK